jgi:hypothetical protein
MSKRSWHEVYSTPPDDTYAVLLAQKCCACFRYLTCDDLTEPYRGPEVAWHRFGRVHALTCSLPVYIVPSREFRIVHRVDSLVSSEALPVSSAFYTSWCPTCFPEQCFFCTERVLSSSGLCSLHEHTLPHALRATLWLQIRSYLTSEDDVLHKRPVRRM